MMHLYNIFEYKIIQAAKVNILIYALIEYKINFF
jgi:hypothetical protein